jgi:hypothetical protein
LFARNTSVVVTTERSYTSQALMVTNKSFTLSGTTGACGAPTNCDPILGCGGGGVLPVIHGNGISPVLFVYGASSVTVENIELTGGGGSQGGGILFGGTGTLTLIGSTIVSNTATDGGGIYASASAARDVNLGTGTLISRIRPRPMAAASIFPAGRGCWRWHPTRSSATKALNGYGGGIMVAGRHRPKPRSAPRVTTADRLFNTTSRLRRRHRRGYNLPKITPECRGSAVRDGSEQSGGHIQQQRKPARRRNLRQAWRRHVHESLDQRPVLRGRLSHR